MKLNYYFSGAGNSDNRPYLAKNCPFRLLSCHKDYLNPLYKWLEVMPHNKSITILLDSGAFTAWSKGGEVLLPDLILIYKDVMKKYWHLCKEIYLINLDKIPGAPGRTADNEEIEECIRISDINYKILLSEFGDRVLPVFHQNEDENRLAEVCNMGQYICVSPRNDLPERFRVAWSQEVHTKIPEGTMTHGLATTGIKMMTRVPWTSVDSAGWIFTTAMGGITICLNGELTNVSVSKDSPNRHQQWQHYQTIPEAMQKVIDNRLEFYNQNIDLVANSLYRRMEITMFETLHWLKHYHNFELCHQNLLFNL
jgi:hypothetical protein